MTKIPFCTCYPLASGPGCSARSDTFVVLEERVGRCQVFLLVWRDFSRVFVAGGEYGYDWVAREADSVEIEALAERFNRPELRQAASLRSTLNVAQ